MDKYNKNDLAEKYGISKSDLAEKYQSSKSDLAKKYGIKNEKIEDKQISQGQEKVIENTSSIEGSELDNLKSEKISSNKESEPVVEEINEPSNIKKSYSAEESNNTEESDNTEEGVYNELKKNKTTDKKIINEKSYNEKINHGTISIKRGEGVHSKPKYKTHKMSKNKKIIVALTIVFLVVLSAGAYYGYGVYAVQQESEKADRLIKTGKYFEAEKIYTDLYIKTGDNKYNEKAKSVVAIKEDNKNLKMAEEYYKNSDYVEAIKLYKKVSDSDKDLYEKAKKGYDLSYKAAVDEIKELLSSDNVESARDKIDYLVFTVKENKELKDLGDQITKKGSASASTQVKILDGAKQQSSDSSFGYSDKIEAERVYVSSPGTQERTHEDIRLEKRERQTADYIKNTDQIIHAKNTNMRSDHSKNSSIIRTLLSGTKVHVIDTYIEHPVRIWCKINYDGVTGWVSYNTINGTID